MKKFYFVCFTNICLLAGMFPVTGQSGFVVAKKINMFKLIIFLVACFSQYVIQAQQLPAMYYSDSSRTGKPVAKDPKIIYFKNKYWMYYSIPANETQGWGIAIATSSDLTNWKKAGEITPEAAYEKRNMCTWRYC
ncbi:MAG: hypothetical protein WKG06_04110 [Segetibacter sp.]